MFTTVAYYASQDEAGAYATIAPVSDQHVRVSGNSIYVPDKLNKLVGAYVAGGNTATAAYIDTPSLRRLALLDITPIQQGTTPSGNESVFLFPYNPVGLTTNEGMKLYLKADPAAAEKHTAVVFLADAALVPVGGEITTFQASATITASAGAWTYGEITFRQDLPVGKYAVVGASVYGANLVAFRFVPVGAVGRPGGIAVTNLGSQPHRYQRQGKLGTWFTFDSTTPPGLEILAIDTCTAQTIFLDMVKVG